MQSPFPSKPKPVLPIPTRRLLWAAATGLGLALLIPLFAPIHFLWQSYLLLMGFWVIVDWLSRPPIQSLRIQRRIPRFSYVGREGSHEIDFENLGPHWLEVRFREILPSSLEGDILEETIRLRPGETASRVVKWIGLDRGEWVFPPMGVRLSRPFGLLSQQFLIAESDQLLVIPGRPPGEAAQLLGLASKFQEQGELKTRRRGFDWEFDSMRDYVSGDEIRRIDWKASSRRLRPQIRQYRSERSSEVLLALDCGRLMGSMISGIRKLDLVMTPILDLASVALKRGDSVGLFAFDSKPRLFLPPRKGLRYLNTMMESFARVTGGEEPSSYLRALGYLESKHRKRSYVIVFTDFTDEISARELYASLVSLSRKHVLIFVAVNDPNLEQIIAEPRWDSPSAYQKAVASQLLLERKRVLSELERKGIFTVDAEPRKLSGPLIRRFLQIRLSATL